MLSVGGNNYRPPLERSKSAPKLGAIEEIIGEEDEEEDEEDDSNEEKTELRHCCKDDHLFPAMTLGRRKCRRGHSIRKVVRRSPTKKANQQSNEPEEQTDNQPKPDRTSIISNSSEDDFVNILMKHEYNSSEPLEGEIMSYFDLTMRPKTKSLIDLHEPEDEHINLIEMRRNSQSLDDLDNYSDDMESGESPENSFFNQDDILDILRRSHHNENESNYAGHSLSHIENPEIDLIAYDLQMGQSYTSQTTPESSVGDCDENRDPPSLISNRIHLNVDSDEGSISSGCETASTVTNNDQSRKMAVGALDRENNIRTIMHQPAIGERKTGSKKRVEFHRNVMTFQAGERQYTLSHSVETNERDSDSEFSDESGYVEEQETMNRNCIKIN